ncbi:MAG: anti-sigma B factor antagonist [Phycisphaerales bacterium]|jgi:anti-sigma B factor antagonist
MAMKKLFGKDKAAPAPITGPVIAESTHIRAVNCEGVVVATVLTPRVSDHESTPLTNELLSAAAGYNNRLVLDLTPVTMLASAGIGMLVQLHNACAAGGGKLVVAGLDKDIHEMLSMTRMDKLLTLADTPAAGRATFK